MPRAHSETGQKCPRCNSTDTWVKDSRPVHKVGDYLVPSIRRRRDCKKCKYRWTTFELSIAHFQEVTMRERVKHLSAVADFVDDLIGKEMTAEELRRQQNAVL